MGLLWSRRWDLNPRPADYESAALPLSYAGNPGIYGSFTSFCQEKIPFLTVDFSWAFIFLMGFSLATLVSFVVNLLGVRDGSLPVLTYHRVGDPVSPHDRVSMSLKRFSYQMLWLKRLGFLSVGLGELSGFLLGRSDLPKRSVILTFDDGYRDILDIAVPVMERFGFKGVVFAVPGKRRSLWEDRDFKVDLPLLDLEGLKTLLGKGWDVGSHGLFHMNLIRLDDISLERELVESKRLLEEGLGIKVTFFSYPYGQFDERVVEAAKRSGYKGAFTTLKGRVRPGDDPYALKRISIGRHSSTVRFLRNVAVRRW